MQSILLFTVYQENYFRSVRLVRRRSVIDKRGAKGAANGGILHIRGFESCLPVTFKGSSTTLATIYLLLMDLTQQQWVNKNSQHKRKTLITFGVIFLSSVLTFTVLAVLFLVKRPVTFIIADPVGNYTFESLRPKVPFSLSIKVEAENENFFAIDIVNATIIGTHPAYNGELGRGILTEITLNRRTRTIFDVDFWFVYDPVYDASGSFIGAVVKNCTQPSVPQGIYAQASIVAPYRTWIKKGEINESRDLFIAC